MSNAESQTPAGNQPSHIAYHIRDGKDKGFFTRIGVAWEHKDKKGFSIQVDFVPLDGKIALRVSTEKK
jgi:hypothetical protein